MVVTETPKKNNKKPGKKRGRKHKVTKKRGRKPSSKVVSKEDLEKEDCIIAHLPINVNEMKKIQDRAHRYCFIANSLSDEVKVLIN